MSVGFLETFRVAVHRTSMAIGRMVGVTGRGDRIVVTPFDPVNLPAILKALAKGKLNAYALTPRTVAVGVTPVSSEQRRELARHVKKPGDEAKVAVRMIRQDARKQIAARGRDSERAVEVATDAAVEEIERLAREKVVETCGSVSGGSVSPSDHRTAPGSA